MTIRQDAWQEQDDLSLAETVLTHIRNGSTQLAAFEEAAVKLNRTSAACGFRWNSEVRKRYGNEIAEAKVYRKQNKKRDKVPFTQTLVTISKASEDESMDYAEQIVQAAMHLKQQHSNTMKRINTLTHELQQARKEIEELKNKLYSESPETVASEDYNALVQILQRARSLGVLDKIGS